MASPTILDFDTLTAPLSGETPAGGPLPYDVRLKLEDLRKEINPDDYDEDDPRRPPEYRKPDWAGIIRLAEATLANTSKDLLVAARLVEALTIERGFAGLRDGVELLVQLTEHGWDRLYPLIEEGETAEVREGPYKWLNQEGYGSRLPFTLRTTPLIRVGGEGYSAADWQNTDRRTAFEAALAEVSAETIQDLVDDLKQTRELLTKLNDLLGERMGEFAPDFVGSESTEHLGAAVNDCLKIANLLLQRKAGSAPSEDEAGPATIEGGSATGGGNRSLASRAEAYRMLSDAADLLQRIEPHSPIPYLVKRAVRLGELRFPELMRALIRESAVLDELDRLMGLDATSGESPSE